MNINQIFNGDVLSYLFQNETINQVKSLFASDNKKEVALQSNNWTLRLKRISVDREKLRSQPLLDNVNSVTLQVKLRSKPFMDKDSRYIDGQGFTAKQISFHKLLGSYEIVNNQIQIRIPVCFKESAKAILYHGLADINLPIVDFTVHENAIIGAYSVEAFDCFNKVVDKESVILNNIKMIIKSEEKLSRCLPEGEMFTLSSFDREKKMFIQPFDLAYDVEKLKFRGILDTFM